MLLFVLGFFAYAFLLIAMTLRSLVKPPRRTYASAVAKGRPGDPGEIAPTGGGPMRFREWDFLSRGVRIKVWDIEGDRPQGPCFILTHGWGDSRIGALSRVSALRHAGSRFITWDLPGHGESEGWSALGAREHVDLRALIETTNTDTPIVLLGWSLGAGVSLETAARDSQGIAAVIAEAPYRLAQTPARNMLRFIGMPAGPSLACAIALLSAMHGFRFRRAHPEPFDRSHWSRGLNCPLLVIHGDSDQISPVQDGRDIAASAPDSRLLVLDDAGHDGVWTNEETRGRCILAVEELLSELSRRGTSTITG